MPAEEWNNPAYLKVKSYVDTNVLSKGEVEALTEKDIRKILGCEKDPKAVFPGINLMKAVLLQRFVIEEREKICSDIEKIVVSNLWFKKSFPSASFEVSEDRGARKMIVWLDKKPPDPPTMKKLIDTGVLPSGI